MLVKTRTLLPFLLFAGIVACGHNAELSAPDAAVNDNQQQQEADWQHIELVDSWPAPQASPGNGQSAGKTLQDTAHHTVAHSRVAESAFVGGYAPSAPSSSAVLVSPQTDRYEALYESGFRDPLLTPLSTFGLDVDTASYSNIRRFLQEGQLPPKDAVRIEELINYFDYPFETNVGAHPLQVNLEYGAAPWNPQHRLAMVQVGTVRQQTAKPNRFVFLIDTSGSMHSPDRLPLLKRAFHGLIEQLDKNDRVAIVTYAGSAGVILPSVSGAEKNVLSRALQSLQSAGATAGAAGITEAYAIARQHFQDGANNRVILATDGDFNVGTRDTGELVDLIETQRNQGIYLTILGFGRGNLSDQNMNRIANHGDGNYYYIDNDLEARRVLVEKLSQSLTTVARDVKLQIEFNPRYVAGYRLLGYETRRMNAEDFRDDKKDAGEVGAGQVVTALYEIQPRKSDTDTAEHALRYQQKDKGGQHNGELMQVTLRYRPLDGGPARELQQHLEAHQRGQSDNLRWAAAVAEFGLILSKSDYAGVANFSTLLPRVETLTKDGDVMRHEFTSLVRQAAILQQTADLSPTGIEHAFRLGRAVND